MLLQSNYKRIWWNWDMNKLKFGNLIVELPKSKLPASAATESGPYLFICSSSTPKVTDSWMQNKPAVVMGTGGVASVSYAEGEFSYSTDTWAFRSNNEEYSTEFLYRKIQQNLSKIDYAGFEGSGLRHLRKDFVKSLLVDMPEPAAAYQITKILRATDQTIEETEALIEKYQQIKAGLIHDLFPRGVTSDGKLRPSRDQAPELYQETPIGWIPKDWHTISFGQCIETLTDYHANGAYEILKKHVELYDHKDHAVMIRTTNFEQNDFSENLKYISKSAYEFLSKSAVFPNDILMNKIANPGVSYLMPDLNFPVSLGMNLFLIRLKSQFCPKFFSYYLKFKEEYVKSFSSGTGTKTITKDAVRSLMVAIASKHEEMERIGIILEACEKKIDTENRFLKKLISKKQGVMKDLLSGKVTVQVEKHETAHV
mgnify:FL=1